MGAAGPVVYFLPEESLECHSLGGYWLGPIPEPSEGDPRGTEGETGGLEWIGTGTGLDAVAPGGWFYAIRFRAFTGLESRPFCLFAEKGVDTQSQTYYATLAEAQAAAERHHRETTGTDA